MSFPLTVVGDEERMLSIHLVATEKKNRTICAIGLDNQAAIEALPSELLVTRPGHHLAAEFLRIATRTQEQKGDARYKVTIRWTAGHAGVEGNKEVDREAKRTAEDQSSNRKDLPKCLRKTIKERGLAILRQACNKEKNGRMASVAEVSTLPS